MTPLREAPKAGAIENGDAGNGSLSSDLARKAQGKPPGTTTSRRCAYGLARRVRWLTLVLLATTSVAAAAAADPRTELLFHRGIAAYGAGNYQAARSAFEAYLAKVPDDAEAIRYTGMIARQEGRIDDAVRAFEQAIELAPDGVQAHTALVETLLDVGRNEEAHIAAEAALGRAPNHGPLQLYAGIAAYRIGRASEAVGYLARAERLDPDLAREARYYTGLAQAVIGNLYASAAALGDVVEGSPGHPLGASAQSLRNEILPNIPDRIWYVGATAGAELDTNPAVQSALSNPSSDIAGTFRLKGLVDAYRGRGITLRGGYEGFIAAYGRDTLVNEQTHAFRALALYDRENVRVSLRYDYAITLLDMTRRFRDYHRVEPTVNLRLGRLGITQVFYGFQNFQYSQDAFPLLDPAFDRDGNQHSIGVNQLFVLPEPLNYARVGILYTDRSAAGTEFDYNGFEINVGGGVLFPWRNVAFDALYRYGRFGYKNASILPVRVGLQPPSAGGPAVKRTENAHVVTLQLSAPVWRQLTASIAATLTYSSSEIEVLNYDRQIAGAYLSWSF